MDRYDAILEQLKKAQSQGVDSVASRLNAVVANLDELLQTVKSTIQDALSTEADEIVPIADVEALVAKMRKEAIGREGAPPSFGVTLENLRTLDQARSQSELLRALLPMLSEHIGRAAVLVIREEAISAWSGVGFGDGNELRTWHGEVTASPNIQRLVENSTPLGLSPAEDPLISGWLGEGCPDEAVLLPISLRGKLMGVVYVDHAGDQPWNVEAAQALNAVACWLIDTLQFRTTVPTPTLAEIEAGAAAVVESSAVEEIEFEPSPVEDQPQIEEPEKKEETVEVDYDFEPEPASLAAETTDAGFDPSATVRVDVADDFAAPETPVAAKDFAPPVVGAEVKPAEPPPAVRGEPARSPEEETRQEEARRFARLLVSEIKLYNEDEVERGRAEKDIGLRLKDDIERSHEMYEKRISEDVRTGHDYFRDELVRILADGDADALGV